MRKKLFITIAAVSLIIIIGISLTAGRQIILGPSSRALIVRSFARTPERLERGRYLVEAVAACMDCHTPHDWTKHDVPAIAGKIGAGQDMANVLKGLPGRIIAPNLTPDPETGAGNWTDDALARAIREGIGHDGRALFPIMPYQHFRELPDEDVASIIVYLRSLAPVRNQLPKTELPFPVKYLVRSFPQPVNAPIPQKDLSNPVDRGRFLVNAAGCEDCHSPQENGEPVQGRNFSGGVPLEGAWGQVASMNLTPDPSGIPYYDEQRFITTIRTGYVGARKLKQIMPWATFRKMTDDDLRSIFAYLRTLPPVQHRVDNTEPPTYCPIDKTSHGGGNLNTATD
jgi:cytochrome c553